MISCDCPAGASAAPGMDIDTTELAAKISLQGRMSTKPVEGIALCRVTCIETTSEPGIALL